VSGTERAGMNFRSHWKEDPEINLIPLIDVLLVILIFLMVTTTYSKYAELQINLPSASAEKQSDRPNEINVTISAAGELTIDRKPVAAAGVAQLAEALKQAGGGLKDPIVIINGDAKSNLQLSINVMEAARVAGYTNVSFAVQQSTGK
jgi:biopolymer transport protein ExbD